MRRALRLQGQVIPHIKIKQGWGLGGWGQSSEQGGLNIEAVFTTFTGVRARTGPTRGRGEVGMQEQA